METISKNENETAALAASLTDGIKAPTLYCLYGDLGAGKSVFARSFIQSLAGDSIDVPSPTFTLVQSYDSEAGVIYHYDLYRIEDPEEIFELGWEDSLHDGIVLVEWPERLGTYLPQKRTDITIKIIDGDQREITIHEHA